MFGQLLDNSDHSRALDFSNFVHVNGQVYMIFSHMFIINLSVGVIVDALRGI